MLSRIGRQVVFFNHFHLPIAFQPVITKIPITWVLYIAKERKLLGPFMKDCKWQTLARTTKGIIILCPLSLS